MSKIKYYAKKFFRDYPLTILLIVCFTLALVIAVNGISIITNVSEMQKKARIGLYDKESDFLIDFEGSDFSYEISKEKKIENLIDDIANIQGNIILTQCSPFILGDSMGNGHGSNVICSEKTVIGEKVIEGAMPESEQIKSDEPVCLLNMDNKRYVKEIDGQDMVRCDSEYYKVLGYFISDSVSEARPDGVYFLKNFSADKKKNFYNWLSISGYVGLQIFNDNNGETGKKVCDIVYKHGFKIDTESQKYGLEPYYRKAKINKLFSVILFVFCLMSCMIVSNLWIIRRKKEIIIRKTMGYGDIKIVKQIALNLLMYGFVSIILAVIIQSMISLTLLSSESIDLFNLNNIVLTLCSMIIVTFASIIVPVVRLRRMLPANGIKE